MRPTTQNTRPVDPELVPLAELRAELLLQQRRAKGKQPKPIGAEVEAQADADAGAAGEATAAIDYAAGYSLALSAFNSPSAQTTLSTATVQNKDSPHALLSLELIQLLLQSALLELPARPALAALHSDSFLLELFTTIYAAWDGPRTHLLLKCRGALLALLAFEAAGLRRDPVRRQVQAQILVDPWLHKRSINCFQILATQVPAEELAAFGVLGPATASAEGKVGGGVAEATYTAVLRRLTEGMAASDDVATLSGKVAFEWIQKVWNEDKEAGQFWVSPVLEASLKTSQGRTNICLYLLPQLFKARHQALHDLLNASGLQIDQSAANKSDRTEAELETGIAWLRVANQLGLIQLDSGDSAAASATSSTKVQLPTALLLSCLHHASSSLRCAAFSLLVQSAVPHAPVPPAQFPLLRSFYVHSLGEDDPEFRQEFLALSGKLLLRLRESVWKARKRADGADYVAAVKAFLNEWATELIAALSPARPFRIKMNALRLLDILLQIQLDSRFAVEAHVAGGYSSYRKTAATPMPAFNQKHKRPAEGKPTPSRAEQAKQAVDGGPAARSWPFEIELVNAHTTFVLLRLLQSTYTALRALAISLLEKFPALPGYIGAEGGEKAKRELLVPALKMVRSGREAEASAGASVIALVWKKCVLEAGADWNLGQIGGWAKPNQAERGPLSFLTDLMDLADVQLDAHAADLGHAASTQPMHGTLIALRQLFVALPPTSLASLTSSTAQRAVFHRALALVERVWAVTSPVLAAAAPEGQAELESGAAVGLADTEEARALRAVAKADGVDGTETETLSGPMHKIILSASWRAMKEAGELLETILRLPSELGGEGFQRIWSLDEVKHVGALFATWLARVRHRGAFMAIHPCYSRACSALLVCADWPAVQALPVEWLDVHLDAIISQKISITRRSAGIPYCILGLLTAVLPTDKATFTRAFGRLFEIAESNAADITDESRVHAMNTIRTTILDAKASAAVGAFFERAFLLSISMFWSANWICRNVALLLYGTLVTRAFSATRTNLSRDAASLTKRLTVTDFFGRYPRLHDFLLHELEVASREHLDDLPSADLHSSLFSVLMLLSLLQSPNRVDPGAESLSDPFVGVVEACATSRVWKIRDAAGDAMTGLIPASEASGVCVRLLGKVEGCKENELHGRLVQVLRLLQAAGPGLTEPAGVHAALTALAPALLSERHSYAVRTTFLDCVRVLVSVHGFAPAEVLSAARAGFADSASWPRERMHVPSAENFVAATFTLALAAASAGQLAGAEVEALLAAGLGSRFLEVQRAALTWLGQAQGARVKAALQDKLAQLAVAAEHASECRIGAMGLVEGVPGGVEAGELVGRLVEQRERTVLVPEREALLPLVARIVPTSALAHVLRLIARASSVAESVESRESAALALRAVGQSDTAVAAIGAEAGLQAQFGLLAVRLAQDDDAGVREVANEVVTRRFAGGSAVVDRAAVEVVLAGLVADPATAAQVAAVLAAESAAEFEDDVAQVATPSSLLFAVERPNIFKDELLEAGLLAALPSASGAAAAASEQEQGRERVTRLAEALGERLASEAGPLGWSGSELVCKWIGRAVSGGSPAGELDAAL